VGFASGSTRSRRPGYGPCVNASRFSQHLSTHTEERPDPVASQARGAHRRDQGATHGRQWLLVLRWRWHSGYDGVITTDACTVEIDHLVALKEAWDSGAHGWTANRRRAFANDLGDPRSLRAVSARSNRSKSDRDPAEWLPPKGSFHCASATQWVVVKVRWHLAADGAEEQALRGLRSRASGWGKETVVLKISRRRRASGTPDAGAEGGTRTHTRVAPQRCLRPPRLPFRHSGPGETVYDGTLPSTRGTREPPCPYDRPDPRLDHEPSTPGDSRDSPGQPRRTGDAPRTGSRSSICGATCPHKESWRHALAGVWV
jgi:hypothetical protein